ncbi:MAG: peptidoglycan-binding protein [Myxococcales bacterium]|nr:peptidoglycan-binding protein [Myxococcales bacterium]
MRPTLKRGSRGEEVKRWQRFLASQGLPVTRPDGIFGRGTHKWTVQLQQRHGLTADGIVGRGTWALAERLGFGEPAGTRPASTAPEAGVALFRVYRPRNRRGERIRKSAGALIKGHEAFAAPIDASRHLDRAVWLAAQVEGPTWGTVQSYDGAGMSGGLLHNTALFPRSMKQGQLWQLIAEVAHGRADSPALAALEGALHDAGWDLTEDGRLVRHGTHGSLVGGLEIRRTLTPPNGNVTEGGAGWDAAKRWAQLFYAVLSETDSRPAQVRYAAGWLVRARARDQAPVYRALVNGTPVMELEASRLPADVELSMCIYHCFVVNAPAPAAGALRKCLPLLGEPTRFAAALPSKLGRAPHASFRKRYEATRRGVLRGQKLGLWGAETVDQVIPALP